MKNDDELLEVKYIVTYNVLSIVKRDHAVSKYIRMLLKFREKFVMLQQTMKNDSLPSIRCIIIRKNLLRLFIYFYWVKISVSENVAIFWPMHWRLLILYLRHNSPRLFNMITTQAQAHHLELFLKKFKPSLIYVFFLFKWKATVKYSKCYYWIFLDRTDVKCLLQ